MLILKNENALIDCDLTPAFEALKDNVDVTAMFKKKEDINKMSKSVLKHRIQVLTGKNIQTIQDEMGYEPVDPNETGMNHDVMKKLAHCLILLAENQLQPRPAVIQPEVVPEPKSAAKKRTAEVLSPVEEAPKIKKGRRSIAATQISAVETAVNSPRRGRKSLGATALQSQVTPVRGSKRVSASSAANSLNETSESEASVAIRCMRPVNGEKLKNVEEQAPEEAEPEQVDEEEEEEEIPGVSNPTPAMKELMKKRRSVAASKKGAAKSPPAKKASPVKKAVKKVVTPPRAEFVGSGDSRSYLIAGDPMQLRLETLSSLIPLSVRFPGAHLAVVHTPANWIPADLFRMAQTIRNLNLSAGLDSFVILMGTGFKNLKMNTEALETITKHVQFVTFHREDANKNEPPTGKLRETTSLFLVAYIFPGCDQENSTLPTQMVADGYTTCFRCENVTSLEKSIIDCFSEKGEWLLDLFCDQRKLTLAAQESGRNAVAVSRNKEDLELLGNYLRTLSMREDDTYRTEDGLVSDM